MQDLKISLAEKRSVSPATERGTSLRSRSVFALDAPRIRNPLSQNALGARLRHASGTALSISTEAVSNALAVHRAARRSPARIDGQSRHKPTVPFVAKYKAIAAEVLRRRKAGEVFEQITLAIKASLYTIRTAHAFAMQTKAKVSVAVGRSQWGAVRSLEVVPFKGGRSVVGSHRPCKR